MRDLLENSLTADGEKSIPTSELSLSLKFFLKCSDVDAKYTLRTIAEITDELFISPYISDFLVFAGDDNGRKSLKKYTEICKAGINEHFSIDFYYDAIRKNEKLNSKKAYREWKNNQQGGIVNQHWDYLDYIAGNGPLSEGDYYKRLIEYPGANKVSAFCMHDLGFMISVRYTEEKYITGHLDFSVSTYVLGSKINEAAERMGEMLINICNEIPGCYGTVGIRTAGRFLSDEAADFVEYKDGWVEDKYLNCELFVTDYMDIYYIDGLEWFNIIPFRMLHNIEELKDNDSIQFDYEEKQAIIKARKEISKHRRKDFASLYLDMETNFRPGYNCFCLEVSDWTKRNYCSSKGIEQSESLTRKPYNSRERIFLREQWQDIYYLEKWYKLMPDYYIYISRGNFDFITYVK